MIAKSCQVDKESEKNILVELKNFSKCKGFEVKIFTKSVKIHSILTFFSVKDPIMFIYTLLNQFGVEVLASFCPRRKVSS